MDRRVYDNYVMQIMKCGSISAAARSLGISQPAMSSGLTHLEKELGYRLINRKDVPITLTPEGEIYLDYINRVRTLSDDLERRIRSYQEEEDRFVSIGCPSAYVNTMIADAAASLLRTFPECRLSIREAPLQELIAMTTHGELDCFISTTDQLPDGLEKRLILMEQICLGIPEGMDPDQLSGAGFIFLEEEQPLQVKVSRYFAEHGIRPRRAATVTQTSSAISLAQRGTGICFAAKEALKGTGLTILPLDIPARGIYAAWDRDLFLSSAARQLITILCGKSLRT